MSAKAFENLDGPDPNDPDSMKKIHLGEIVWHEVPESEQRTIHVVADNVDIDQIEKKGCIDTNPNPEIEKIISENLREAWTLIQLFYRDRADNFVRFGEDETLWENQASFDAAVKKKIPELLKEDIELLKALFNKPQDPPAPAPAPSP